MNPSKYTYYVLADNTKDKLSYRIKDLEKLQQRVETIGTHNVVKYKSLVSPTIFARAMKSEFNKNIETFLVFPIHIKILSFMVISSLVKYNHLNTLQM